MSACWHSKVVAEALGRAIRGEAQQAGGRSSWSPGHCRDRWNEHNSAICFPHRSGSPHLRSPASGLLSLPEEASQTAEQEKQADQEPDEPPRRTCPACKEPTLELAWQDPVPRMPDLMRLVIWPQQRTGPFEHQAPLPTLEPWLPGGDEHLASQYAQIGCSAASGFT